tara:strand:- start:182 stop:940 length:759 start_codon:yes stop_codon:yes gene_type:complete
MTNSLAAPDTLPVYSRENPSSRYTELLSLYTQHHSSGDTKSWSSKKTVYPGKSLWPFLGFIHSLCRRHNIETLLDYGAGKGMQYTNLCVKEAGKLKVYPSVPKYWGVNVTCYDPANPRFNILPEGRFDAVISTDVLEHCPEEDLRWIIGEFFAKAKKCVFANIACYPAQTILPNGENAHATIKPPEWWQSLVEEVASAYPDIKYYFVATPDKTQFGTLITNDTKPLEYAAVGALPGNVFQAWVSLIVQKLKR